MDETALTQYLTGAFAEVATTTAYGYTFFFFGDDRKLPFATLGAQDDDYDRASNLNRPGVFRLNIGVSRDTYRALFGPAPPAWWTPGMTSPPWIRCCPTRSMRRRGGCAC